MNNIYLIGMPGSGKSTIGKNAAKKSGLSFVDLDDYIVKLLNMSINEIFEKHGEKFFRDSETTALEKISKSNNTIVATGGGIILKDENIEIMKKTGVIVFIDTPVELILSRTDFSDRPLLKNSSDKIYSLFDERYVLYKACSDKAVICDSDLKKCTDEIFSIILNRKGKSQLSL